MVDNMEDYANAMKYLKNIGTYTFSYDINSHGRTNYFKIGNTNIEMSTDVSILREGLHNKLVFIDACNVTSDFFRDDYIDLSQKFAEQTKSTVIASCHSISSLTKYDGVDIFYEPYTLFQAPNYQFNLFKMTIKGGQRMSIFDVRIDKFRGISWDWKDDHFMRNIITYYCNP